MKFKVVLNEAGERRELDAALASGEINPELAGWVRSLPVGDSSRRLSVALVAPTAVMSDAEKSGFGDRVTVGEVMRRFEKRGLVPVPAEAIPNVVEHVAVGSVLDGRTVLITPTDPQVDGRVPQWCVKPFNPLGCRLQGVLEAFGPELPMPDYLLLFMELRQKS